MPFQVRGRFLTALSLRIVSDVADDAFYAQLDDQLLRTPQFFAGAPMVLDLAQAPGFADPAALGDLVANLRSREFRVFGVENAGALDRDALQGMGLIPVEGGRDAPLPREPRPAVPPRRPPRNRRRPPRPRPR